MTESKNFKWMDKPTEFEWTPEALVDWAIFHEKNQANSVKMMGKDLLEEFKTIYYPSLQENKKSSSQAFVKWFRKNGTFNSICLLNDAVISAEKWEKEYEQTHEIESVQIAEGEFLLEEEVAHSHSVNDKTKYVIKKFFVSGGVAAVLTFPIPPKRFYANVAVNDACVCINVPVAELRKITEPVTVYPEGIVGFKLKSKFNDTIHTYEKYQDQGHKPGDYQNFCRCFLSMPGLADIWTTKNSRCEFSVGDKCTLNVEKKCISATILYFSIWENMILVHTDNLGTLSLPNIKKPDATIKQFAKWLLKILKVLTTL